MDYAWASDVIAFVKLSLIAKCFCKEVRIWFRLA